MLRFKICLAALAVSYFSVSAHAQTCTPFTDVLASDPFCSNIQWMYNRGVTLGCTATQYCPTQLVRRDQMAAFMNRLGNVTFQQGGNAFGATARLGTSDGFGLELQTAGKRAVQLKFGTTAGPNDAPNIVNGHLGNVAAPNIDGATIAGGGDATVACGPAGGISCVNRVTGDYGAIGGGTGNTVGGLNGTIGGGTRNTVGVVYGTVSGGFANTASGIRSTVIGGDHNTASGTNSTVLGGTHNVASGIGSVAAGTEAHADQHYCFVFANWALGESGSCLGSPYIARFLLNHGLSVDYYGPRVDGGGHRWVYIGDLTNGQTIATWSGATLTDSGVWTSVSDVAKKQDFQEIDKGAVLERLAELPIRSWRYISEPDGPRRIGPTAQDFGAAFGLGEDQRSIGMIDADGIALASIQGLNAKLEAQIAHKDAEILALRERLTKVEMAHASDLAGLRLTVEMLMARTSAHGRLAKAR